MSLSVGLCLFKSSKRLWQLEGFSVPSGSRLFQFRAQPSIIKSLYCGEPRPSLSPGARAVGYRGPRLSYQPGQRVLWPSARNFTLTDNVSESKTKQPGGMIRASARRRVPSVIILVNLKVSLRARPAGPGRRRALACPGE